MTDVIILAALVVAGLFIAVQLYRALARPAPTSPARPRPSTQRAGDAGLRSKGGSKKGKSGHRRKGSRQKAPPVVSHHGEHEVLAKVRTEEDEDLDLTKLTIPSLMILDEETAEEGFLSQSSRPNVIPIVYDEDADVDLPSLDNAFFLISAVGQSEQGRRKRNEDRFFMCEKPHVYAVADGMGGHAGGDVASKMAVEILDELMTTPSPSVDPTHLPKRAARLVEAVTKANLAVFDAAQRDPRYAQMGSTLVCARFSPHKKRVYIAHVGDSRCYVYRQGRVHQITSDHTLSQLTGLKGPQSNRLVRALGVAPTVQIDLILGRPAPGDRYLLCSDGLCNGVSDEKIAEVLAQHQDPNVAVAELIDRAMAGGTRDNVTVIVVDVQMKDASLLNVAS